MRGYERQEAGVTPAQIMEEGFRVGWAREHPDKPLPEETLRMFAAWAAKPAKPYRSEPSRPYATRSAPPAPPAPDDIDPFAEDFRPPARPRIDPDGLALAEEEVRARMAAAAATRAQQEGRAVGDPVGAFFATMEVRESGGDRGGV